MRLGLSPSLWRRGSRQNGFTLVEVLVGVTITVTVITATVAVLTNVMASQNRMLRQTEQAESLRVASAWITRDARLAKDCRTTAIPVDALQLIKTRAAAWPNNPIDYVEYKFLGLDENGAEVFDPDHLHRWEYQGGNFISETIVGWNMAPYDSNNGTGTAFGCSFSGRAAQVQLEAKLSPGQTRALSMLVVASQRNN
ncbi:MAG TPA: prepilin-type N-terminal cleavage/methylation domain-containing protein [Symbiobacteriaceae bacterium]|jgi:prepilin-type N-terminal cleavage/methylation domain-containing protein|nr:prepilin-type N-terminal cleavage/methylation domain-containing protein [Symbiobacteriaceae bacterium]